LNRTPKQYSAAGDFTFESTTPSVKTKKRAREETPPTTDNGGQSIHCPSTFVYLIHTTITFVFHIITVEAEEKPPSAKKVKKEKKKKTKVEEPAEEEVRGLKNGDFTCG
jgi:hypothetical protein